MAQAGLGEGYPNHDPTRTLQINCRFKIITHWVKYTCEECQVIPYSLRLQIGTGQRIWGIYLMWGVAVLTMALDL